MLRRLRSTSLVVAGLLAGCTTPAGEGTREGDPGVDVTGSLGVGNHSNAPPKVVNVRFDPSRTVGQCEPTRIIVTAVDPDGDSLTFTWAVTSAPQGGRPTLQAAGNTATFSSDVVGTFVITVNVDDGKHHVTRHAISVQVVAGTACNVTFADIIHAYHGTLVDRNLREIKLNKAVIDRLQDSMIDSLTSVPELPQPPSPAARNRPQPKPPLDPGLVHRVLRAAPSEDLRILSKSVLIQKGIDAAPVDEKAAYQYRLDLIHERSLNFLNAPLPPQPQLNQFFGLFNLIDIITRLLERIRTILNPYNLQCAANSVPVPPDWPTGGWMDHGELPFEFNFLESGQNTHVWTFENTLGVCYALPRMTGDVVNLAGIICQSRTTGKACFWDNIENGTGLRITGAGITLPIGRLQNGSNLAENCTECHRGGNVFLIHPNTILGDIADREPTVRYSPLGQAAWQNPAPLSEIGAGACSGCHEIAQPTTSFCAILRRAAERTMPCTGAGCRTVANPPAGWDSPQPAYAAHITFFKTRCP